jgi:glycine C-acetyltransferase
VITGDEAATQRFASDLFAAGVFAPAIVFPTVARGSARIRTIVTADHTEADLDEALAVFGSVGASSGLVG